MRKRKRPYGAAKSIAVDLPDRQLDALAAVGKAELHDLERGGIARLILSLRRGLLTYERVAIGPEVTTLVHNCRGVRPEGTRREHEIFKRTTLPSPEDRTFPALAVDVGETDVAHGRAKRPGVLADRAGDRTGHVLFAGNYSKRIRSKTIHLGNNFQSVSADDMIYLPA